MNTRRFNANAIYVDHPNTTKDFYKIKEDFKDESPYELLFCDDLTLIMKEYDVKKENNKARSCNIELFFCKEGQEEVLVKGFYN